LQSKCKKEAESCAENNSSMNMEIFFFMRTVFYAERSKSSNFFHYYLFGSTTEDFELEPKLKYGNPRPPLCKKVGMG
jgi:hypothetical protein